MFIHLKTAGSTERFSGSRLRVSRKYRKLSVGVHRIPDT